jgi:hypothetical protein
MCVGGGRCHLLAGLKVRRGRAVLSDQPLPGGCGEGSRACPQCGRSVFCVTRRSCVCPAREQIAWQRVRAACLQIAENRMRMVDVVLMQQRNAALLAVQNGLVTPHTNNAHITKQGDLNHYTLARAGPPLALLSPPCHGNQPPTGTRTHTAPRCPRPL